MRLGKAAISLGLLFTLACTARAQTPGAFSSTGGLSTARQNHTATPTATVLNNGMVLTAGGYNGGYLSSAELYNPATGTFTAAANLNTAREYHTSTLLANGLVLIVGGYDNGGYVPSAELYNPGTGIFTVTGSLNTAREYHTATLLNDGTVLIAGGYGSGGYVSSSEVYNPFTGTFTVTGSLNTAREYHTATLLNDGTVLIAGGYNGSYLSSAEVYNPSTGAFTVTTGSLNTGRGFHTATLLNTGMVLLAGGVATSGVLSSAELYNPSTRTFALTGTLNTARKYHAATLLGNGLVLVAAGYGTTYLASAELYNPATGTFTVTGSLGTAREYHTATVLNNGQVLVAGGNGSAGYLASAELYSAASASFTVTGNLNAARYSHTATLLDDGTVLVAGGYDTIVGNALSSGELYNPTQRTFSFTTGSLPYPWYGATATLLNDGTVLIAGGSEGGTVSAEVYNPSTEAFTATGNLNTPREDTTATLLNNGMVLITGGWDFNNGVATASAELYNPATGTFTFTGNLHSPRFQHTATLLGDGTVLIVGGGSGTGYLTSAEVYNPTTGAFTVTTGSLAIGRDFHTATLLNNGMVLIAGGISSTGYLASTVLYNPATQSFTATGSLHTARDAHTATLLNDGTVLIAGGGGTCGSSCVQALSSAELYNSASGTFAVTGSLSTARSLPTATLLSDGTVLIAGGSASGNSLASAELYQLQPIAPLIGSISPASGPVGTSVTIAGSSFGAGQGTSTITFNGITATPTSWSATMVVTPVPSGATSGSVVVTVGGIASNGVFFTVTNTTGSAPSITSLSPTSGSVGTSVTITGTNFGSTQGSSTVFFNGLQATPSSWSGTSIAVRVPNGATSGCVQVTVAGVGGNCKVFTVTGTPPTISNLSPPTGAVGASITITGMNFGVTQGTSTVKFNGTTATPASWGAANIVAPVPTGATSGNVVVSVSGIASNGVKFTVVPAPSITSLSVTSGTVGTEVTITGTNFGATQGTNFGTTSSVTFNGTVASVVSWSATSIVAIVPNGATTGNVVVIVSGVASNGKAFTVLPTPSITSLSPTSGPVGTSVTITGTNFGSTQGTSTVKFGGITATPTTWSASSIVAPVPSGAATGNVVVTVSGAISNGLTFTVVPAPSITSLLPTSGSIGTSVTITGTNFGSVQGTSVVTFNGIVATPTSWISTKVVTPVPNGATTGNVVVTVSGVASNGVSFTVAAAPRITSLSPTSGTVGTSVTISGLNFGSPQGTSTVTFNGTSATPTSWTSTSIAVPVPTGATTGNVVVTVSGVASNGMGFTVTGSPTITNISPSSGAIGSAVTITGTNFGVSQGTSTVKFNGTAATAVAWSGTTVVAEVPNGATTGNVVVAVSGVASNGVSFTVLAVPAITGLSPALGPVGSSVTVSGANFGSAQGTSTIKFNGTSATPTSWSATSIAVPVPSGATTGSVVVTVSGIASNGVTFTVSSNPNITSLSPTSGAISTSVTINGTNFGTIKGTSVVTFNGTAAPPTSWSSTKIVAPVPNGASTGNVVVTVSGVASNGVAFTVTGAPSITSLSISSGSIGTAVTITGTNFGSTQGSSFVTFNGVLAAVTSWGATSVGTAVPNGATTGNVVVTVLGVASNGVSFTVAAAPSITSLAPTSGLVGTPVTITGANFGSTKGTSTVTFNGVAAATTTWSATSIATSVPTGATSGSVVVTVGGVPSNAVGFSVANVPSITGISPSAGGIGTPVTITGTNFGTTQGISTVTFNGIAATPTSWNATTIVAPVPNGGTSGNVVVTVGGSQSNGKTFNVANPGPSIVAISPTDGPVGSQVTIFGANFGQMQGTSQVLFNGTFGSTTVLSWSSATIVALVPFAATTGPVTVQVGSSLSNGVVFVVTPPIGSGGGSNTTQSINPLGFYDYGFDAYSAPDVGMMQTVWNWSPFYDIFAYIGGSSKKQGTLGAVSPIWTGTLGSYGWGIAPVFVGRQPPKTTCQPRTDLSYYTDPTGTQDGTNDGNEAADAADSLAMPFSIIYANIEPYNINPVCDQPVQNYVSAWVNALHNRGYLAGVYFHYTNFADMQGQSGALPDAAWVTYVLKTASCTANSPYGVPTIPDSYPLPNRRAHQFDLGVAMTGACDVFGNLTTFGPGNSHVDWSVEDTLVLPWSSLNRQLPAPLLVAPFNGTVEPPNTDVTLQWNALDAAIYAYWVVVSSDLSALPLPDSNSFGCQGSCVINNPSATNSGTIPGCFLEPGVTYYWTVQGLGVYKLGAWQFSGSFTVGTGK
jgi:hypothetical protein